ncbi:heavy-metal-associated domain-containing protein [Cuniculiplasma sp. SKW3]|uniref:heavy-metal-associated domain-containing protein n=1 Tax=unclassified Cuniculiplasma TaxID=2619706 RepID=UPI003FD41DF2
MAEKKVTLKVFGMTCDDCVRTVSKGLKEQGADVLSVSLKDGMAIVKIDNEKISPEVLVKAPIFGEESHYKAQLRKVE